MPFPLSILSFLSFLSVIPPPPRSTLFPYTTLFRSVVYDFVNVIQGEATLNQALIRDKQLENLFILPASQTRDRKSTRLNSSHVAISYAVFCLKKKKNDQDILSCHMLKRRNHVSRIY